MIHISSSLRNIALLFLAIIAFSPITGAAAEKAAGWNLVLPVNVTTDAKQQTKIAVKIPDSYKPVADYNVEKDPTALMEFIPRQDKSVDNWTKIITVKSYPGLSLKSNKEYLDTIVAGFKQNASKSDVLEGDDKKQEGFEEGYRLISYTYNNRDEIVYIYSASGPSDTAMVQDAIKLDSADALEKAKTELKEFMKNNVSKVK